MEIAAEKRSSKFLRRLMAMMATAITLSTHWVVDGHFTHALNTEEIDILQIL